MIDKIVPASALSLTTAVRDNEEALLPAPMIVGDAMASAAGQSYSAMDVDSGLRLGESFTVPLRAEASPPRTVKKIEYELLCGQHNPVCQPLLLSFHI